MRALDCSVRGFLVGLFIFLSLSVTIAEETKQEGLTVRQAWARATPQGSKVGVAYLIIEAKKGRSDTLLSAISSAAGKVEIHAHQEENDIVKMRRLESLPIPDGQTTLFEPRGLHLMLLDLKKPLKEGERLPLTLIFKKAGSIDVEAQIKPIGSKGPHTH